MKAIGFTGVEIIDRYKTAHNNGFASGGFTYSVKQFLLYLNCVLRFV